jgi:hypothetical protein
MGGVMNGEELYNEYSAHAAELPGWIRKHEALPAWSFLQDEIKEMWEGLAATLKWAS